jgi:hypothetical protein
MDGTATISMPALRYDVGGGRSAFQTNISAGSLKMLIPNLAERQKRHSGSSVTELKNQLMATGLFLRYPLLLAISSKVPFEALGPPDFGIMKIPLDADITLVVGSLRYSAINAAIADNPELAKVRIPISCYDKMEKNQIFDDGNLYYSPTERRFNRREIALNDEYGRTARDILAKRPELEKLVHNKETRLTQGSKKIFTIMSFRLAVKRIHERYNQDKEKKATIDDLKDNMGLCLQILILGLLAEKSDESTGKERRQRLSPGFLGPNIILKILGDISGELMAEHPDNWKIKLEKIKNFNQIINEIDEESEEFMTKHHEVGKDDRYKLVKKQVKILDTWLRKKLDLVTN